MKTVNVTRTELYNTVVRNRAAHLEQYQAAHQGYRKAMIDELEKMLASARGDGPILREIKLPEPINRAQDYDRVITMLQMSVDDHITLDQYEFDRYVLDNWDWKPAALHIGSTYTG